MQTSPSPGYSPASRTHASSATWPLIEVSDAKTFVALHEPDAVIDAIAAMNAGVWHTAVAPSSSHRRRGLSPALLSPGNTVWSTSKPASSASMFTCSALLVLPLPGRGTYANWCQPDRFQACSHLTALMGA